MNILSFDIGGTAIKSALIDNFGVMTAYCEHSYEIAGREGVLKILCSVAENCAFDAIGISTAGLVDTQNGSIIFCSEAIPQYTGTPLKAIMQEKFDCPVWVINDVNAAALGEAHFGAGSEFPDFICLTFGTSIGGAIVINKRVYSGKSGFAGEIGHTVTHFGGKACVCGGKGCYGQYASVTALVERCESIDASMTDGRVILSEFHSGNKEIRREVDAWIDEIILGLITITHVLNPPAIILGGGIMQEEYITTEVQLRLSEAVMPGYKDVAVLPARLGNKAGLMGSAKYTWEKCSL